MRGVLVTICCVVLAGCSSATATGFLERAFVASRVHYRVRYQGSGGCDVLPVGWRLDSHRSDPQSRCGASPLSHGIYDVRWSYDVNNDGRTDGRSEEYRFDLRYEHVQDGSVIWARSLPLDRHSGQRTLATLARDLVDQLSGASYAEVTFFGPHDTTSVARQRSFATRVIEEGPAIVGDQQAYLINFDLIDVQRAESQIPGAIERVTIVLFRPGRHMWTPRRYRSARFAYPMVIVVGYSARPELFDSHLPDLESMLSRIDVRP